MNTTDLLQAIVEGTTTAVLWAAGAWLLTLGRNRLVERRIRSSLSSTGLRIGRDAFGVTVKNSTDFPIVIRDVTLLTDQPHTGIRLQFADPTHDYLFTEKQTTDLLHINLIGRPVTLEPEFTSHGFVELPPHTGGVWLIDDDFLAEHRTLKVLACHISAQYNTIFGTPKLLAIDSSHHSIDLLAKEFANHVKRIEE